MQTITEEAKKIIQSSGKYCLFQLTVSQDITDPELLKAQKIISNEWISVNDRWPTKEDEDEMQRFDIVCWDRNEKRYFRSDSNHEAIRTIRNVSFWKTRTPLPSTPTDKQP